jgi:hypothetical protein
MVTGVTPATTICGGELQPYYKPRLQAMLGYSDWL